MPWITPAIVRGDAQGALGRVRAHVQVAEEAARTGARRAWSARRASRPRCPCSRIPDESPDVSRRWMPATSLTPARPPMAPLTSATRNSERSTRMPANRAACGLTALRPAAAARSAVRVVTYQATTRTTRAITNPRWRRDLVMSCGQPAAAAMGGDSGKPFGSRHGPCSSAVDEQQRHRVEQQRGHHLVDAQPNSQERGHEHPRRPRERSARDHEREGHQGVERRPCSCRCPSQRPRP